MTLASDEVPSGPNHFHAHFIQFPDRGHRPPRLAACLEIFGKITSAHAKALGLGWKKDYLGEQNQHLSDTKVQSLGPARPEHACRFALGMAAFLHVQLTIDFASS